MEAARVGPFGVSIFAGGAAYKILGNRTVKFSTTKNAAGLPAVFPTFRGLPGALGSTAAAFGSDTYDADWSFEVDSWEYRGMLGVRFHWLGD